LGNGIGGSDRFGRLDERLRRHDGNRFSSSPRPASFTSLVCAMIGQHSGAYGLPEVNLMLADFAGGTDPPLFGVASFLQHGLIRAVAQLYGGEQTIQTIAMARRWPARRRDRTSGEVYRSSA
jgi:hypothetical protein